MIVASLDDMFFKFIENPEAWGFVGLLILTFILDRILTYRFYTQAIRREQSDINADNQRQHDLIKLIGGYLSDIKKAIDNNTEAFNRFATSHVQLERAVSESVAEFKDAVNQIMTSINTISMTLNDLRGSNQREYEEMRQALQQAIDRVEKLIQELPNGDSENADAHPPGSGG